MLICFTYFCFLNFTYAQNMKRYSIKKNVNIVSTIDPVWFIKSLEVKEKL